MGRKVWVPVVSGPLAPFAAGFASWLASRAYSPWAAADRLYQFDQLSRWMAREGLGVGELTGEQAERFAAARRAAGLVAYSSPFPTRQGRPLSRYTVGLLLGKHGETAAAACPSLGTKRVTPHVLRHTAAMLWRAKEVDIATIALLLGHGSIQTTHIYEHADPALKENAINRTAPLGVKPSRYRPSDTLLAFLEKL